MEGHMAAGQEGFSREVLCRNRGKDSHASREVCVQRGARSPAARPPAL